MTAHMSIFSQRSIHILWIALDQRLPSHTMQDAHLKPANPTLTLLSQNRTWLPPLLELLCWWFLGFIDIITISDLILIIEMIILIFYLATFITEIKTGSTLQDCKSVALKFSNTCPGAPDLPGNWSVQATMKPVTVKCQCGSAPSYYECDLFHMLCVTCYLDDQD